MKHIVSILIGFSLPFMAAVAQNPDGQRLTIGGYGEVALTRNFYSDNVYRYSSAASRCWFMHLPFTEAA
ncbi:MAG: hypothetical protein J5737_03645 [Bacteroidales bacterium]|nr:hypothetical protein [Bacteroidales bacterium]